MNAMTPIASPRPLPIIVDEAPGVVANPERIVEWARTARQGDRFTYATRSHLPPGSAGAMAVRLLAARGIVLPRQRRMDDQPELFAFWMIRSAEPWVEAEPEPAKPTLAPRSPRVDDGADYQLGDLLLPLLEKAAQFGRPCPTDKELARRVEVPASCIPSGMEALRLMQAIVIHAAPAPTLRLVTIVSNGARTGYAKSGDR